MRRLTWHDGHAVFADETEAGTFRPGPFEQRAGIDTPIASEIGEFLPEIPGQLPEAFPNQVVVVASPGVTGHTTGQSSWIRGTWVVVIHAEYHSTSDAWEKQGRIGAWRSTLFQPGHLTVPSFGDKAVKSMNPRGFFRITKTHQIKAHGLGLASNEGWCVRGRHGSLCLGLTGAMDSLQIPYRGRQSQCRSWR